MIEELLDVLDINGNKTGEVKSRAQVHKYGDWHRAVHIWIVNSRQELLIQKRSMLKQTHAGKWDISVAGHVEAGQSSLEATIREIKEELGLDVNLEDLKLLSTIKIKVVLNNGTYINNEFDDIYLLKRDLDISRIKLQQVEVSKVKYITTSELERVLREKDQSYVQHDEEYKKIIEYLKTI